MKKTKYTIQIMTKRDIPSVVRLYRYANSFTSTKNITTWTQEGFKYYQSYNLIAQKNKIIIGGISGIRKNKKTARIEDIAILPKYRNAGVGRSLLNYLLRQFKKDGIRNVELWVHWKNLSAIPFYYKNGFRMKKLFSAKDIDLIPDNEDFILCYRTM